jgi:xylulose-5-phosphate/fructose-6-phosphate phosphoketolase
VVLVGIGVELTFEVIAAAALLRKLVPALRVRVVNVTDLMILGPEGTHPHAMMDSDFDAIFTRDRAVHFDFHGYPIALKGLLFGRPGLERVTIEGYREEGTTTSPFDVRFPLSQITRRLISSHLVTQMMLCNHVSRYHVAAAAIRGGARVNSRVAVDAHAKVAYVLHLAEKDRQYIYQHGAGRSILHSRVGICLLDCH